MNNLPSWLQIFIAKAKVEFEIPDPESYCIILTLPGTAFTVFSSANYQEDIEVTIYLYPDENLYNLFIWNLEVCNNTFGDLAVNEPEPRPIGTYKSFCQHLIQLALDADKLWLDAEKVGIQPFFKEWIEGDRHSN